MKIKIKSLESRDVEIANLLQNANKSGLAKSFQMQHRALQKTWRFWAGIFGFGISLLLLVGWYAISPMLVDNTALNLRELAVHAALLGPCIWLTWFAARQYGQTLRVSEDYAFKEAAALAFVGYRDEMAKDPEMLRLLQEAAIRTFGDNPAHMLLRHGEPASPLQEVIAKFIDKTKPRDLAEMMREVLDFKAEKK